MPREYREVPRPAGNVIGLYQEPLPSAAYRGVPNSAEVHPRYPGLASTRPYGSVISAASWPKPLVAALADKIVIVQIRISVIDALDLVCLPWTERLCRIQTPDAF
jgi:hypothetical protein